MQNIVGYCALDARGNVDRINELVRAPDAFLAATVLALGTFDPYRMATRVKNYIQSMAESDTNYAHRGALDDLFRVELAEDAVPEVAATEAPRVG